MLVLVGLEDSTAPYSTCSTPCVVRGSFWHQPIIYPSIALFPRAFAIASQIRVSVYDAIYLALAEQENCPLVTADIKLINAAQGFSTVTLDSL